MRQQRIAVVGTDDAHLGLDRYADVPYRAPEDGVLRIGVTHAPYLRVLDAMAADGFELILAGHTHGGQLCVPGFGALVTNCDLPVSQAKGLHRRGDAWLHVSAGLGHLADRADPVRLPARGDAAHPRSPHLRRLPDAVSGSVG